MSPVARAPHDGQLCSPVRRGSKTHSVKQNGPAPLPALLQEQAGTRPRTTSPHTLANQVGFPSPPAVHPLRATTCQSTRHAQYLSVHIRSALTPQQPTESRSAALLWLCQHTPHGHQVNGCVMLRYGRWACIHVIQRWNRAIAVTQ